MAPYVLRYTLIFFFLLIGAPALFAQSGFVKSAGQPIPGATVTATQGARSVSVVTDADGHYAFPLLNPGSWTVTVDMFGFDPLKTEVDYSAAHGPVNFNLLLKPSPVLQRLQQFAARRNGNAGAQATGQNLDNEIQNAFNAQGQSPAPAFGGGGSSNESFLVSGSLSPGMSANAQADSGPGMREASGVSVSGFGASDEGGAAPGFGSGAGMGGGGFGGRGGGFGGGRGGFRGPRPGARRGQFGNHRRPSQIRGMASFTLNNSAVNAKPFSINGLDIPQAAYAQSRFSLIVGGPLVIPKIVKDPSTQFFLTYFGTRSRNPKLFAETVPTAAERSGDFSAATQSLGTSATAVPVTIFDPATRQPFPGNRIPANLLSPISLGLLNFYPLPNQPGTANNYQYETAQASNSDNLGLRIQRSVTQKDRLSLNFQYRRLDGTTANPFQYFDATNGYGLNAQVQWTRNLTPTAVSNSQVRFNRNVTQLVPHFAFGADVQAELGISGSSGNPMDYGPPTLNFTNFGSLSDGVATLTRNQSQTASESISLLKGSHTITLGIGYTRADRSTRTDPNGRGTLNFTGLATSAIGANRQPLSGTGYDLADFLLGYPQSSSIRYGDPSNYFFQNQWNGYVQDEWKLHPRFTLLAGIRYEYFSPFNEKYGQIANLDIAPNFTGVSVVTPNQPGLYTGAFPGGLINPDLNNWAPRVGIAWNIPGSKKSTLLRAGYGIYYNGQAYVQFASQLAQQPPFAVSNQINTSAQEVLTVAQGFLTTTKRDITNTFAVERNYRTPYAQTWNISLQKDLPGGFFGELGYVGTKGTDLDVRILPNQAPPGSPLSLIQRNQLGNAVGFTYDESAGNSSFNALQLRTVRRFNHGLSLNLFYQFAKSIDDSSTFGGVGNTVAQNWLDISAERGLSSFDVRHEFNGGFVWTSPAGGAASRISAYSKTGRLLKDWQFSGSVTAQTGNPLTARILGNTAQLAQTGGVGSERASATGQPIDSGSGFFNLNAFTTTPPGEYGNAGRNTIPGPGLVSLNLAVGRTFPFDESRRRLEFRVEGNNVLNHVNYTSFYTVVNAVDYGLPSAASSMRTLDLVVRFRF